MFKSNFVPGFLLGIGFLGSSVVFAASSAGGTIISNNTPRFQPSVTKVGAPSASSVIEVSVWLQPHNKAEMDSLAKELYNPKSSQYRNWVTKEEFAAKFAPTATEAKAVESFLNSNKLTTVKIGPNNFYVRAKGTVAEVEAAFHVTLENYNLNGTVVRANTSDPWVSDEAAPYVASIAGLDSLAYKHPLATRNDVRVAPTAQSGTKTANAAVATTSNSSFISQCFTGTRTETETTSGSEPIGTYTGNGYTNSTTGCGYTPQDIRDAYQLNSLYKEGYDGSGQTIAILDWCGSTTILSDANAFSAEFGLPKLTSSNFQTIYTPAPSYCAAPDPEINIDVEWAHAIAPGANIDLVVPPSNSFQDVDEAFFYAVNYQLGNVISGSYGSEESGTPEAVLITEALISEQAALTGISANFSSGDDGDFTFDNPTKYPASVSAPADSPYATAVGGISLVLNSNNAIKWQSGWGTNLNPLSSAGTATDPPSTSGFFNFGSGGGPSAFFNKPSYQSKISGTGRQVPDISWLADPYTGAYIAISVSFAIPELQYQVYGGTSLACPMFSALWAIANQEAGAPLGQAAPYLYSMPSSTITDIVPVGSSTNVTGKVVDSKGTTHYTAAQLATPLEGTTTFYSSLWNIPLEQDTLYLLTFGTDSGLRTAVGYDNVTGLGVPTGKAFADYFKQ